jgi:hypothetical protein
MSRAEHIPEREKYTARDMPFAFLPTLERQTHLFSEDHRGHRLKKKFSNASIFLDSEFP